MSRRRAATHILVTPELCRMAYRLLCETAPFDQWNMPDSSDVIFTVNKSKTVSGFYKEWSNGENEIGMSSRSIGTINNLIWVMAHEMTHLFQRVSKPRTDTRGVEHNRAFRMLSDVVCAAHHFDRRMFAEID